MDIFFIICHYLSLEQDCCNVSCHRILVVKHSHASWTGWTSWTAILLWGGSSDGAGCFYCDCLEDNGLLRFSLPPLSTRPRTRPRENAEVENGPEMSLVHLMSRTNCEPRPVDISCALQWCIRVYLTCVLLVNNWIMMHCGSSSCRRSAIAWREAGFAGLVS